ncbi:MAG: hypothetical protein HYV60_09640 [Planctomycetia bacterium]|nr:hypothetical protein [Planctomycetia bacterium]
MIPNTDGLLRVGDYAKATIDVPLSDAQQTPVYDPELANKWISPRHPHVIADSPGPCPICGVDLVPAAQYGFTDQSSASADTLAVPRDAVLMAGNNSVVYVETAPGRFEIRRVVLGPSVGDQIVIRSGVSHGELVATRGNFLIDSQMQLAGNPSLIDPSRLEPTIDGAMSVEMIAALSKLSPEDRVLVERQKICPIAESRLGVMGTPKKVDVNGTPIFICCERCRKSLLSEPDKYLAKLEQPPIRDADPQPVPQMDLPPFGVPILIEEGANDE